MNWVFSFFFCVLVALGYYGYSMLESKLDQNQQDIAALQLKLTTIDTDNRNLKLQFDETLKHVGGLRTEIEDLARQPAPAPEKPAAPTPVAAPPAAPAKASPPPNKLGDITTTEGKIFHDCKLLKVENDCIVFSHADGIMQLAFGVLPDKLKARFGYDPAKGANLTDAQVAALEKQRLEAENAGI